MAKWTQSDDELWLLQYLPKYRSLTGKSRVKNNEKRAFLVEVYEAYNKEFPKRIDTFNFTDIYCGGTNDERQRKMIDVSRF